MSLQTLRTTDAVYWAPATPDGFGGWTFAAPVQIKCRIQVKTHRAPSGIDDSFTTDTIVYADRELNKEGWIWVGLIADLTSTTEPRLNSNAWKVKDSAYSATPDNRYTVYKAII